MHPTTIMRFLALMFAFNSLELSRAQEEDLPYSSGSTGVDGALVFPQPVPISHVAAAAYDSVRKEVVVYGGYENGNQDRTWVWAPGSGWVQKFPTDSPGPLYNAAMAYDAERGKTILYGGINDSYSASAETWEWDGENWTKLAPANNAGVRSSHQMVYDTNLKKIFLLGGRNYAWGDEETYAWDGTNWTRVAETGPNPDNSEFAMAYDVKNGNTVYFGSDGTWTFDGTTWTKREVSSPRWDQIFRYSSDAHQYMAYDPVRQNVVLVYNNTERTKCYTWIWDGASWTQKNVNETTLLGRGFNAVSTDTGILAVGGYVARSIEGIYYNYSRRTETWDGTKWTCLSASFIGFDMSSKAEGVWNYTTISVHKDVNVYFLKNTANTPVKWLATGNVLIDGTLFLNGQNGQAGVTSPADASQGGPGGFQGGLGGIRSDTSGSYAGTPGEGPGGGRPGTSPEPINAFGYPGEFSGTYGNVYLQPMIGGSGGGGSSSDELTDGASGGGGGGAILIASSRDITVNGKIEANGGDSAFAWYRNNSGYVYSGPGSGGAVRLVADRVLGQGEVSVKSGNLNYWWNGSYWAESGRSLGRIRVEGFLRNFVSNGKFSQPPLAAEPTDTAALPTNLGALVIKRVAGKNVAEPPSGQLATPDVVFTEPGEITVEVEANGIPDGSPVKLRISMAGGLVTAGPVNLSDNKATFTVKVPAGSGTIQASTSYAAPTPTPAP